MSIIMISREFVTSSLSEHFQRFPYSCFPSAIEMMQIIERNKESSNLPTADPFCLQDKYTDYFTEQFFHRDYPTGYFGLIIQKIAVTSMKDLDFSTIIEIIDNELSLEKTVLIETYYDVFIHAHVLYNYDDNNGNKTYHSVTGSYGNPSIDFKDWSVSDLQIAMITPNNTCAIWLYKII